MATQSIEPRDERAKSALRSGIVTLLTDFGVSEAYVGVMKGVLYRHAPNLRAAVDLTHAVPAQDVAAAAFHLRHAWSWFPVGTVHVAVVDPGVGTERAILVAEHAQHFFLAPDNGLLAPILESSDAVHRLDVALFPRPSSTFHGRDLFAPAAARLVEGATPADLGPPLARAAIGALVLRPGRAPQLDAGQDGPDCFFAAIEHIDHFGNVILDLPGARLHGDLADWFVEIAGATVHFAKAYGAVQGGELLALVNSYGAVEIAVRDGDAAQRLNLLHSDAVTVRRRT